jgi:hypothetical protein
MDKFTITCNNCGSTDCDTDHIEWEDYIETYIRCNNCDNES